MLDKTKDVAPHDAAAEFAVAADWLTRFESALTGPDADQLTALFHPDSHWRDVLALSWNIQTVSSAGAVIRELKAHAGGAAPKNFQVDPDRAAPRTVTRAGTPAIEAMFKFETKVGRGSGLVRLIPDANEGNAPKAWTLLTALDELKGFEEQLGTARPRGEAYSRDFRGPNWLDLRKCAAQYTAHDPDVLVVGGGQAGLAIAARLKQLQIDALIVDR